MNETILCAHERTESPDQTAREMHSHNNYEIFSLLSGDADFLVEGGRYRLAAGDLLLMRKGEVHMFRLRSDAPYERMHINFDLPDLGDLDTARLLTPFLDRPLGKWNHYPAAFFPELKKSLADVCLAKKEQKLYFLFPLLCRLEEAFESVKALDTAPETDRMEEILSFLNAHLTEEISLDHLCRRFYLSPAHLNRLFRKATGTTAWRYITVKRLFLAREALEKGEKPTHVFARCGFRDYSTFFRAYKKHFHAPPKEKTNHLP